MRTRVVRIYKKTEEIGFNCLSKITLDQIVEQKLTEEQYEDLEDYFYPIVTVHNYTIINDSITFELINKNEVLKDCPLPDGTVVADKEFEDGVAYVIVLGYVPSYGKDSIKIGINI